ncbi:BRCA2, oligonucleotide/oligosaccharide-binding, domain 1-domain-containing protein [Gorgonomyces haynaldii]|nr:BRCA2, oligonucleotide/oligosaccharide-binding, domain 1-domain-containing protein [Gorgonomyces haynaldii]
MQPQQTPKIFHKRTQDHFWTPSLNSPVNVLGPVSAGKVMDELRTSGIHISQHNTPVPRTPLMLDDSDMDLAIISAPQTPRVPTKRLSDSLWLTTARKRAIGLRDTRTPLLKRKITRRSYSKQKQAETKTERHSIGTPMMASYTIHAISKVEEPTSPELFELESEHDSVSVSEQSNYEDCDLNTQVLAGIPLTNLESTKEDTFSGFTTASNKKINLDAERMQQMLAVTQILIDPESESQAAIKTMRSGIKCALPSKINPTLLGDSASMTKKRQTPKASFGFTTAGGKNLSTKKKDDVYASYLAMIGDIGNTTQNEPNTPSKPIFKPASHLDSEPTFSTGSGKKLSLSVQSTIRAHRFLNDITNSPLQETPLKRTPLPPKIRELMPETPSSIPTRLKYNRTPFKTPTITPRPQQPIKLTKAPKIDLCESSLFGRYTLSLEQLLKSPPPTLDQIMTQFGPEIFQITPSTTNFAFGDQDLGKMRKTIIECGANPELLTVDWIEMQYGLILWKCACYCTRFADAADMWSYDHVLNEIKLRYQIEINEAKRSCLKASLEQDDHISKWMVLCVSKIGSDDNMSVELTDGWYRINAILDSPLRQFVRQGKIRVGMKLHVQGLRLTGTSGPRSILEASSTSVLLSANGTRPAKDSARMGYQGRNFYVVSLSSIVKDGGNIACVDIIICTVYPSLYSQKNGKDVMERNEREELEADRLWRNQYTELRENLEKSQLGIQEITERLEEMLPKRNVTKKLVLKIRDYAAWPELAHQCSEAYLTILNPDDAVIEAMKEGKRFRAYQLSSHKNGEHLQLQATRETRFQDQVAEPENLMFSGYIQRTILRSADLFNVKRFTDVDMSIYIAQKHEDYILGFDQDKIQLKVQLRAHSLTNIDVIILKVERQCLSLSKSPL